MTMLGDAMRDPLRCARSERNLARIGTIFSAKRAETQLGLS